MTLRPTAPISGPAPAHQACKGLRAEKKEHTRHTESRIHSHPPPPNIPTPTNSAARALKHAVTPKGTPWGPPIRWQERLPCAWKKTKTSTGDIAWRSSKWYRGKKKKKPYKILSYDDMSRTIQITCGDMLGFQLTENHETMRRRGRRRRSRMVSSLLQLSSPGRTSSLTTAPDGGSRLEVKGGTSSWERRLRLAHVRARARPWSPRCQAQAAELPRYRRSPAQEASGPGGE